MSKDQQDERRIYLDSNASTPLAPEAAAEMKPFLIEAFGNPSSRHWAGAPAREAVETARMRVAELLGAAADEIVFTSGGTEANNAAIKGAYFADGRRDAHVITCAVEHPATLESCKFLARLGAEVTVLGVDRHGRVDPADVESAISDRTILVTLMHANNEVGTIQPIAEIASVARARRVLFHADAAQSAGKIPTRVGDLGVDLLSIAGHKLYAPKGIGALFVRRGVRIEPLLHGGGHEAGRRAGTESALLTSALGAACALATSTIERATEIRALRDRLWLGLSSLFGSRVMLNGHPEQRLPNTLNVSFVGRHGADVLAALGGVAASTGSACHEGSVHLSPVLRAMGVPPEVGMGAVRFSLGRTTTVDDIEAVLELAARAL
jgi:cysteine desulfurase